MSSWERRHHSGNCATSFVQTRYSRLGPTSRQFASGGVLEGSHQRAAGFNAAGFLPPSTASDYGGTSLLPGLHPVPVVACLLAPQSRVRLDCRTSGRPGCRRSRLRVHRAILHDVGRVALAILRPDAYTSHFGQLPSDAADPLRSEQEVYGMDHCGRAVTGVSPGTFPREWRLSAHAITVL